jgi:hypothetical protein
MRVPGVRPAIVVPCALRRLGTAAAMLSLAASAQPAAAAGPVETASTFSPYATVSYQHDSNVFTIPGIDPTYAAAGITQLGDSIIDYEAGVDSLLNLGADSLTLDGQATRAQYDRYSFLDQTDYKFHGDYAWHMGSIVDGTVSYLQSRYMAAFTDTLATSLLLDTERTALVAVRVLVTPEWRLDLTPEEHWLDTPVPGFGGFGLRENIGVAGLDYLGFGRLTAGLQFTYDSGRYTGIEDATRYDQRSEDLTASYRVGAFSTFKAEAGYTTRDSEANPADSIAAPPGSPIFTGYAGMVGTTSAATGALTYQREITGKTSASLVLFRRVDSYSAGANPEIGTGGALGVAWKADAKITVNLAYNLEEEQIKGGLIVIDASNRTDRTQTAQLAIRYQALSWLTIRPYANWQRATSTFTLGNYSATIVGVDVTARLRW